MRQWGLLGSLFVDGEEWEALWEGNGQWVQRCACMLGESIRNKGVCTCTEVLCFCFIGAEG